MRYFIKVKVAAGNQFIKSFKLSHIKPGTIDFEFTENIKEAYNFKTANNQNYLTLLEYFLTNNMGMSITHFAPNTYNNGK